MFIVYINNLSDCVQKAPAFGYADDFKVITSSLQEVGQATKSIQQCTILSISGETPTSEKKSKSRNRENQKDLGVILSSIYPGLKTAEKVLARAGDPSMH